MTGLNRSRMSTRWHAGSCPACGKRSYNSKQQAKAACRETDPGCRPYRCLLPEGLGWHVGHLAAGVVAGRVDRDQAYGGKGDEP